jgi:hypothetical protein
MTLALVSEDEGGMKNVAVVSIMVCDRGRGKGEAVAMAPGRGQGRASEQ